MDCSKAHNPFRAIAICFMLLVPEIASAEVVWPRGVVPYEFDSRISEADVAALAEKVESAASKLFNQTSLRFNPRHSEGNFVQFQLLPLSHPGCGESNIGRIGGKQLIKVRPNCSVASMLHEMLHALGRTEEQNRPDRDNFVTVHLDRVLAGFQGLFLKATRSLPNSQYDFTSIMHGHSHYYASSNLPTLIPKGSSQDQMGKHENLSLSDEKTLHDMYVDHLNCNGGERASFYAHPQPSQTSELHVVSVVGGANENATSNENLRPVVNVTLGPTNPGATLVLNSTYSVNWRISRTEFARYDRILLLGHYPSEIFWSGERPNATIERKSGRCSHSWTDNSFECGYSGFLGVLFSIPSIPQKVTTYQACRTGRQFYVPVRTWQPEYFP